MERALRLISWYGREKEEVLARAIRSQADARKLGPFIDTAFKPACWVGWSKPRKGTGKKTPPHFRHYPQSSFSRGYFKSIAEEVEDRKRLTESSVHKTAKDKLTTYLQMMVSEKKPIRWAFNDERVSSFPLVGNLLADVESVQKEFVYKTSFGFEYKFDIALLGRELDGEPMLLGAVELEKEHRFGMLKCLVCKALGFPMASINLESLRAEDISDEWVASALSETTASSEDGLRRNYIYIHNALYPVFLEIPYHVRGPEDLHQFVVFCKEEDFKPLEKCLTGYQKLLELITEVHIDRPKVNESDGKSIKMFANEGSIAGENWAEYNSKHYFRIQMKVPRKKEGPLYLFHMVLGRLLNSRFDTLTGYKYAKGIKNLDVANPFWQTYGSSGERLLIAPKQLSEHIKPVLDFLEKQDIVKKSTKTSVVGVSDDKAALHQEHELVT
jgi:hypothetical protein